MSKFNIGDTVRCTRTSGGVIVGELYKVHKVRHREDHGCTYVYFSETAYLAGAGNDEDGFELVKPADNPLKVGDKVMLEKWEEFYEILEVKGDEIKLQDGFGKDYWYSASIHNFEKEATMTFDPNKKYRTVNFHHPVRVVCTDVKGRYPVLALLELGDCEVTLYMDKNGMVDGEQVIEKVPEVDWSKVPVDALIFVSGKYPRHFAKYEDNRVHYYSNGTSSKTYLGSHCVITASTEEVQLVSC